jgi:uncharacterized protein
MPERLAVFNESRQLVLSEEVAIAGTSHARRKGLLGMSAMPAGFGLWIAPCEAVHTFAMKFQIDVIFLDRQKRVIKLSQRLPPWRIAVCWRAHSVLELEAGVIEKTGTAVSDSLRFQPI